MFPILSTRVVPLRTSILSSPVLFGMSPTRSSILPSPVLIGMSPIRGSILRCPVLHRITPTRSNVMRGTIVPRRSVLRCHPQPQLQMQFTLLLRVWWQISLQPRQMSLKALNALFGSGHRVMVRLQCFHFAFYWVTETASQEIHEVFPTRWICSTAIVFVVPPILLDMAGSKFDGMVYFHRVRFNWDVETSKLIFRFGDSCSELSKRFTLIGLQHRAMGFGLDRGWTCSVLCARRCWIVHALRQCHCWVVALFAAV